MADRTVSVAAYRYEHTEALFDGRVAVDGVTTRFETAPLVSDIFRRMIQGEFDVAELGLTTSCAPSTSKTPRSSHCRSSRTATSATPRFTSTRAAASRSRKTWPARP
jgi:hypothetical protein